MKKAMGWVSGMIVSECVLVSAPSFWNYAIMVMEKSKNEGMKIGERVTKNI